MTGMIARLSPVGSLAAGFGAFNVALAVINDTFSQGLLRILTATLFGLTVALVIFVLLRHIFPAAAQADKGNALAAHDALAASIVAYGVDLSDANKHAALIDLRNRASRMLHLFGARKARQELGTLALRSAAALKDRLSQASILVDDLGWSVFEDGRTDEAAEHIEEAIGLLDEQLGAGEGPHDQMRDLRAKANRHMATIEAERHHFDLATDRLAAARTDASRLPQPERDVNVAQLDYTEAHLSVLQLEMNVGPAGYVDSDPARYALLLRAGQLCDQAEDVFSRQSDLERLAKVAHLRCRIARHRRNPAALREADANLREAELRVSRNLRILRA
jgi:hypothetical protein